MYELLKLFDIAANESQEKEMDEEEFEKMYSAPAEIIVLLSIFYGVISFIAIVGNSLVIWVVATTRQMHTVTNMYIANLALADVIIGMFCVPFQFQAALLQKWHLPEFMCAFCPFVQAVSVNVSVFTLTAIAVDRHRAIINPLRARPTRFLSKMIILGIWVAALSFAIPFAIAFRVIPITDKFRDDDIYYNVTRPFCENVNLTYDQLRSYRYYLVFVQYVVPLWVISFVYIQMAVKLWGSRTPGNAQDARDRTLLINKKKVIKMLIIVVVVFGICWLPLQTYNILYVTWPDINEYQFINIIWFCCDWLAMSNSCYNPFIYGIYNEKFKREFNKRFTVCFCRFTTNSNDIHDRTMSVYTRASSIRSTYASTRRKNFVYIPYNQQNQQNQQQSHQQHTTMNGGTNLCGGLLSTETNGNGTTTDLIYASYGENGHGDRFIKNSKKESGNGSIYNPLTYFVRRDSGNNSNNNNSNNKKDKKNSRILFAIQDSSSSGDAMELVNCGDSLANSDSYRNYSNGYYTSAICEESNLSDVSGSIHTTTSSGNKDKMKQGTITVQSATSNGRLDEIGDGLRKHIGRVVDTNRNKLNNNNTSKVNSMNSMSSLQTHQLNGGPGGDNNSLRLGSISGGCLSNSINGIGLDHHHLIHDPDDDQDQIDQLYLDYNTVGLINRNNHKDQSLLNGRTTIDDFTSK